jgi:LEA14-like dessication related protein
MSKSSKPSQNKSQMILISFLVVAGVILVIIAGNSIIRGNGAQGVPALVVDNEEINLGEIKLDTPVSFTITVTNQGDGNLQFLKDPYIEVVEGC